MSATASVSPMEPVATSTMCWLRAREAWCTPGVSMKMICAFGRVRMPGMRLRVVCGRLDVMASFWPRMRLSSVDLPTLGWPISVTKPQ